MFENGIHASVNLETLLGLVKWQNIINEQEKIFLLGVYLTKRALLLFLKNKVFIFHFILSLKDFDSQNYFFRIISYILTNTESSLERILWKMSIAIMDQTLTTTLIMMNQCYLLRTYYVSRAFQTYFKLMFLTSSYKYLLLIDNDNYNYVDVTVLISTYISFLIFFNFSLLPHIAPQDGPFINQNINF